METIYVKTVDKMKNNIECYNVNGVQERHVSPTDNMNVEIDKEPKHDCRYNINIWAESTTMHGVKYCLGKGSILRRFGNSYILNILTSLYKVKTGFGIHLHDQKTFYTPISFKCLSQNYAMVTYEIIFIQGL